MIVETAVVLPVFMLIMTGLLSFSIAIYQKLQMEEAICAGAHLLASDHGAADPCLDATNQIYAASPGLKQSGLVLSYTIGGTAFGSGVTSCPSAGGLSSTIMGSQVLATIHATYPCKLQVYGVSFANCNLESEVSEVVQ